MSRPVMTVERALRENLSSGKRYLLAVSGGIDSVALLHGTYQLRRELKLEIEVAHLDHGLRQFSAEDAEFVSANCKDLDIKFHLKKLSGAPEGENVERWGRRERYAFFSELIYKLELDAVLTAHNADDVAETFLMRLIANKELKSIEKFDPVRLCLRPLLNVSRATIVNYATANGLKFREDKTNLDQDFLRNKIRHTLIPFLEENFDPRVKEVLSIRASGVEEDIRTLENQAAIALAPLDRFEFGSKEWLRNLREILLSLESTVAWRVVDQLLIPKLGFNLGREHSCLVLDFIIGNADGIELPTGVSLRRKDGGLKLV